MSLGDFSGPEPIIINVLFLVPQGQFHKHLHTLAGLAKLLLRHDFRDGLEDGSE